MTTEKKDHETKPHTPAPAAPPAAGKPVAKAAAAKAAASAKDAPPEKPTRETTFADLKVGDRFVYQGQTHVKALVENVNGSGTNAVRTSGGLSVKVGVGDKAKVLVRADGGDADAKPAK